MLFLCGRTGTGRYEYQLWNAGGRRCYRRCEDHRAWSRVYLYRWKRTGGYLRKWNSGSAERTDPDRTCQKKWRICQKRKYSRRRLPLSDDTHERKKERVPDMRGTRTGGDTRRHQTGTACKRCDSVRFSDVVKQSRN